MGPFSPHFETLSVALRAKGTGRPYLFPRPHYLPLSYAINMDYLVFLAGTCLCQKASLSVFSRPYYSMHDT
jgi:hypothetical protein